MVIRRRDAEAGADADAETQITIDFEAEGSSMDACQKQFGSTCEAKLTQIGRMRDANVDTISFVKTQSSEQAVEILMSGAWLVEWVKLTFSKSMQGFIST